MRPKNNFALTWEELTFHGAGGKSWFRLDQHKNVNKGIKARGGLTVQLVDYLLSIRPQNARGLIPSEPRHRQGVHRHSEAVETAAPRSRNARARDVKHLMGVVRMMGDTSLTTVNKHYFNIDDEILQEIIEGWSVPEVDLFDDAYSLPLAS